MLHRQLAEVEEALGAVRHAALLALLEIAVLDRAGDALPEADICQGVNGYEPRGEDDVSEALVCFLHVWGVWAEGRETERRRG